MPSRKCKSLNDLEHIIKFDIKEVDQGDNWSMSYYFE